MAENIDAERAAFEAWHRSKFATKYLTGQPTRDMHNGVYAEKYGPANQQQMWEAWQAARRTPSASTGEDGLPELPKDEFCAWLLNGRVANAFTHGVGDRAIWDRDQYWSGKGYDRAPLFTADQTRQFARDAIAADRRRSKREMPPELKAAIEEAHKTRATGALLPDGSAVFINYGHDYGDNAHLECTACGGSGHIDDQRLITGRYGEGSSQPDGWIAPAYITGELTSVAFRDFETARSVCAEGAPIPFFLKTRPLAAPPLPNEQQGEKGAG